MKRALVLSLAVVLGLGVASFAQTLTGTWDTTITINPSLIPPTIGINTVLTVNYSLSGWVFGSKTTITNAGWFDQVFTANGALGAFTIGSTLDFAPAAALFEKWTVISGVSIAGVGFTGTFTLVPGDLSVKLVVTGPPGLVNVMGTLTFGTPGNALCDFNWTGITIVAGFPFSCADVTATLIIDCAGFKSICFDVQDIVLPGITWATLDFGICFTPQTKSYTIGTDFSFLGSECFTVYLSDPGSLFGDITVDGIGLVTKIGGVQFTALSFWGDDPKPGLLKGTDYWEVYQIKTTDDGCCGPFAFDIAVYFLDGGVRLFDVALINANMTIQLASQFTFGMGIKVDLEIAAFTEWSLKFIVKW